jgi:hypothetical protein
MQCDVVQVAGVASGAGGSKRTLLNDLELLVSHQPNDPLFCHTEFLRAAAPFESDAKRKYRAFPKRAVKSFAPESHLRVDAGNPVFVRDHRNRSSSPQVPNTIQSRFTGHLDPRLAARRKRLGEDTKDNRRDGGLKNSVKMQYIYIDGTAAHLFCSIISSRN